MIRRAGIVSKPGRADITATLERVTAWLEEQSIEYDCDVVTAGYLGREGGFQRANLPKVYDLMIVFGGDGTLLSVARGVGPKEIPLLAVNLGGLGFLMTTGPDNVIDTLEQVLRGEHRIQRRTVLDATVHRGGDCVGHYFALNDVVVNKAAMARLLLLEAYVDEEFVCDYRADGLIISTPTGSTAYSLAAGGPVVFPSVEATCLTPICPHMLSHRPVILPEDCHIEVRLIGGDDTTFLTIDGQVGVNLQAGDRIRTRPADHRVRVVQPPDLRFFEVLRSKMGWGER